MFEKIKIKNWLVEVDKDKTAEANKVLTPGTQTCGCSGCKNFDRLREQILGEDFIAILASLGIDYKKDIEVSEVEPPGEGKIYYNGWYYANGRLLEGVDSKSNINQTGAAKQFSYLPLTKNLHLGFTNSEDMAGKNFPKPIVQVEFVAEMSKNLK